MELSWYIGWEAKRSFKAIRYEAECREKLKSYLDLAKSDEEWLLSYTYTNYWLTRAESEDVPREKMDGIRAGGPTVWY